MAHPVLVVRANVDLDSIAEWSEALRLPVIGCAVNDEIGNGSALFDPSGLSDDDREILAASVYEMYRMVAPRVEISEPESFTRECLPDIRRALREVDAALEDRYDAGVRRWLVEAAGALRAHVEHLAFALESWDAAMPVAPDA